MHKNGFIVRLFFLLVLLHFVYLAKQVLSSQPQLHLIQKFNILVEPAMRLLRYVFIYFISCFPVQNNLCIKKLLKKIYWSNEMHGTGQNQISLLIFKSFQLDFSR